MLGGMADYGVNRRCRDLEVVRGFRSIKFVVGGPCIVLPRDQAVCVLNLRGNIQTATLHTIDFFSCTSNSNILYSFS
jgi:hypothetical protein